MRDEHILPLLDSNRFGSLSESDALLIERHIAQCDSCQQAHAAAKAAAALLHARAGATIEPSPFFTTRVMAAVREQQNEPALLDLVAMWKTARGLLLSAISVVVLLAGLTFLTPQPKGNGVVALASGNYSTEGLVFSDELANADASPSNEQVMEVVFTPEDTDATNQK